MPSRIVSDGDLAFMPTSNDSLYANGSLQSPPATSTDAISARLSPARQHSASASPSRIPLPPEPLDGMTSPGSVASLSYNGLQSRDQIVTASSVPSAVASAPASAMADGWHAMYNSVVSLHENERNIWKMERQKLTEEIEKLKLDVSRIALSRSDSGVSGMGGKENGASESFYNADIVKQANEKLRQISQVSPGTGTPTSEEPPPVLGGGLSRKSSIQKRLPSITEKREPSSGSPARNVGFSLGPGLNGSGNGTPSHGQIIQEDPYSPPTTAHANMLSPPPENFVRHAGHTPLRPRSKHGSEEEDKAQIVPAGDGVEEDRELSSPKVLATTPDGDLSTLSLLDKRLQVIAENPDEAEHQPEAIRLAMVDDNPAQAITVAAPEVDGGIRLKTRRSMNFGAPLGQRS